MSREEQLRKLQGRARELGEDLRALTEQIEDQEQWQREQLDMWANRMSNLLTFLLNLDEYLEMSNGGEGGGADGAGLGD